MLDKTWQKMYQKAKAVQGFREISSHMEAGGVAAAVLSDSGRTLIRDYLIVMTKEVHHLLSHSFWRILIRMC